MKTLFAFAIVALVAGNASATCKLNAAEAAYLSQIRAGGSASVAFLKEVAKIVDPTIEQDLYDCTQISSVVIQKGASMHGGQVNEKKTTLISHNLRVGTAGMTNDASVLALVTTGSAVRPAVEFVAVKSIKPTSKTK